MNGKSYDFMDKGRVSMDVVVWIFSLQHNSANLCDRYMNDNYEDIQRNVEQFNKENKFRIYEQLIFSEKNYN